VKLGVPFYNGSNEISKNSDLHNKPEGFFVWVTLKHYRHMVDGQDDLVMKGKGL